jgi:hypothetical protein
VQWDGAIAGLVGWSYNERTAQHAYRSWWSSGSDDRVVAGWFVYPSRRPTDESQTNGGGYVRSHACGPQQGPRRFGRRVEPWSRTHASEVASPFRDRYGSPSRERRIATLATRGGAGDRPVCPPLNNSLPDALICVLGLYETRQGRKAIRELGVEEAMRVMVNDGAALDFPLCLKGYRRPTTESTSSWIS